jgi:hypothetical protein
MEDRIGYARPERTIRVTLASYIHDPVLPFARFFRSPFVSVVGAQRMAHAKGRSLTRVVRRRGGSRLRQRDPATVSERFAVMLGRVPVHAASSGFVEYPGLVGTKGLWVLDRQNIDAWLRRIADGDTVAAAGAALRIHVPLQKKLAATLERLRTEFRVCISAIETPAHINLIPPRRIRNDGGIAELMSDPTSSDVLVEMCDSWLKLAAMPSVPSGIPGTISAWEKHENALPALTEIRWKKLQRGALEFRAPAAQDSAQRSAWPLFRWIVLLAWIHKEVAHLRMPVLDRTGPLDYFEEAV